MDNLTIEQQIALKKALILFGEFKSKGRLLKEQRNRDKELLEGLNNLHNKILTSQEPLGEEFEKVLYDNLWDLYIRDDE